MEIKKRYKKTHKTAEPGLYVHINYCEASSGETNLSAYATHFIGKTEIRIDEDIHSTTSAQTGSLVEDKEKLLIGRITEKYRKLKRKHAQGVDTQTPFSDAFGSLSEQEKLQMCPRRWRAAHTKQNALAFFKNTTLPILDGYGRDLGSTEILEAMDVMRARIARHGNSSGAEGAVETTLQRHTAEFNQMYPVLCTIRPEFDLPEVRFPDLVGIKRTQTEQCKALTPQARVVFASLLLRQVQNDLSTGGVLMMGMARTAEACAPKFGDILFFEHYAVYGIINQSDGKVQVADLKTDAAYRVVVLQTFLRISYACA